MGFFFFCCFFAAKAHVRRTLILSIISTILFLRFASTVPIRSWGEYIKNGRNWDVPSTCFSLFLPRVNYPKFAPLSTTTSIETTLNRIILTWNKEKFSLRKKRTSLRTNFRIYIYLGVQFFQEIMNAVEFERTNHLLGFSRKPRRGQKQSFGAEEENWKEKKNWRIESREGRVSSVLPLHRHTTVATS